ncbi:cleavage and polyadenylation specificity factor subunit 2 [Nematocida displodere]|uniref:Cleavage and polyadenylation specificity factor subunit 2 n=1 Tax=Nematocida displodere TaxID=1805483 RepID=A0A177EJX5_9MICR|nr:cleavage and polyadenylation specificity factor subunit 2 [Nematocida displodere]
MKDELVVTHVERSQEVGSGCMVVEVAGLKLLVNFGTRCDLDLSIYTHLEQLAGITHILLCSSDVASLGALVYLETLGIKVPIIGTVPIKILGRIEVMERLRTLKEFQGREIATARVDEAFDRIIPLKYMQTYELAEDVIIGPFNSGSSLGGAIWKIQSNGQEWVVFDRVNHRKEAHLDGMDISSIKNSTGIIVNSSVAGQPPSTRKARDKALMDAIASAARKEGKVFIPTSFSQLLEIVTTIHNCDTSRSVSMALYSFYGKKYFDSIKTILEWAGSSILQKFNQEKENPFNLPRLSFYDECPDGVVDASVIFVIAKDGLSGFAPVILPAIAKSSKNTIVNVSSAPLFAEEVSLSPVKYTRLSESEVKKQYKHTLEEEDKKEKEKKIDNLVKKKIEDSSEEEEDRGQLFCKFWYEVQNEIVTNEKALTYLDYELEGAGNDLTFPAPGRRKASDDYGESIYIPREKEEEELQLKIEVQPAILQKKLYKITVKSKRAIKLKPMLKTVLFTEECDIFNLKVVLTDATAEKLVVYGENSDYRAILTNYLAFTATAPEVHELQTTKEIVTARQTLSLKIQNDLLMQVKMEPLGGGMIGYISGRLEAGEKETMLVLSENELPKTEPICLGAIKLSDLRQMFNDAKLKSEVVDDKLVINENIFIYLDGTNLTIDGELSKEFYSVKNILSQAVAFLTG